MRILRYIYAYLFLHKIKFGDNIDYKKGEIVKHVEGSLILQGIITYKKLIYEEDGRKFWMYKLAVCQLLLS